MRVIAALLLLTACGTRLSGIASALSVEPHELHFAATATGDRRTLPLTLTNQSRAPLELTLAAPAPFALALDVKLGGGEARTVDVSFAPEAVGSTTGTLAITGDLSLEIPLSGEGVAPAQCESAAPCHRSHRDPETNTCVDETLGDGTACTSDNACLAQGQCLQGVCMGTAVSCDDADRCTVDACEPVGGCVHFASSCPEPEDTCHVARCDPSTGCLSEPAADGTPCGESDCVTAHVCMAGACKVLPVPEGYACGEDSPCRAKGHCQAGACNQAPATDLVEAWHRTLSEPMSFRGVTDAQGNLYWLECIDADVVWPCELVSATPSGVERFHAPLAGVSNVTSSRHLWSQGRVFVGDVSGTVLAFDDTSGALVWKHQVTPSNIAPESFKAMVADHHGQLQLGWVYGDESSSSGIETLSAATGAVLRERALVGDASDLVLDAQDNLYVLVYGTANPLGAADAGTSSSPTISLISFAPSGAVRFSLAMERNDPPVAALGQDLLLASGQVRSTLDGTERPSTIEQVPVWVPSPLISSTARFRWSDRTCPPTGDCPWIGFITLEGWAAGATTPRFTWGTYSPSDPITEDQLLADGSALFASREYQMGLPGGFVKLRAIDSSGAQKFSCVITTDPDENLYAPTALTGGRWAVVSELACPNCLRGNPPVLRVFSTPGLSVAASGWTGEAGNPGRSGAPR